MNWLALTFYIFGYAAVLIIDAPEHAKEDYLLALLWPLVVLVLGLIQLSESRKRRKNEKQRIARIKEERFDKMERLIEELVERKRKEQ